MTSSRPNSRNNEPSESLEKTDSSFAGNEQGSLFSSEIPGSMNDAALVRQVIAAAMKKSPFSRAQIAERMSVLTGTEVTERMLNAFAAESREDHRFPCELERAFCAATGDYTLMSCRAKLAGLQVVSDEDVELLNLGREYLRQKRAAENMAGLEAKLRGVKL